MHSHRVHPALFFSSAAFLLHGTNSARLATHAMPSNSTFATRSLRGRRIFSPEVVAAPIGIGFDCGAGRRAWDGIGNMAAPRGPEGRIVPGPDYAATMFAIRRRFSAAHTSFHSACALAMP